MRNKKKIHIRWWALLLAFISLLLSVFISKVVTTNTFSGIVIGHVEHVLERKSLFLNDWIDTILSDDVLGEKQLHEETGETLRKELLKKEIALFIYRRDSLIYWSDNTIPLDKPSSFLSFSPSVTFIGNGWYMPVVRDSGEVTVIGLVLVKHHYPVKNQFLQSDFFRGSWLGDHYILHSVPDEGGRVIHNHKGDYLFSLSLKNSASEPVFWQWISLIFMLLSVLSAFYCIVWFVRNNGHISPLVRLVISFGVLLLYMVAITGRWMPEHFFELSLFSPFYFALASWCPSIGDLFFQGLILFFLVNTVWIVRREGPASKGTWLTCFLSLLTAAFILSGMGELLYQLVMNSSLVFEPYRILDISVYSLLGYFSIGFLFVTFLLVVDDVLYHFSTKKIPLLILSLLLVSLIFPLLQFAKGFHIPWYTVILFWASVFLLYWGKGRSVSFSIFLIAILAGLYTSIIILHNADQRREQNGELLAVNLAAEHDPVAELLMDELDTGLKQDTELRGLMSKTDDFTQSDVDQIFPYLQMTYFNGYWDKYDLQVTLCKKNSSIRVDAAILPSCFGFYQSLIKDIGTNIDGTSFYFLDTQDGLVTYLGAFYFPAKSGSDTNGLYIRLNSKIMYDQLGYPELLLDEGNTQPTVPKEFMYAKYYNRNLVAQKGDFPFPVSDKDYTVDNQEFTIQQFDGYRHVVFRPNVENTMVISYELEHFTDYLISFAYLFVFFFLLLILCLFGTVFPIGIHFSNLMLKQKIQLWIISLLLFIFLLVGAGTIFFSKEQFYDNHLANLKEKLQSVYVELEHKLSFEDSLDQEWYSDQYASLNDLLVKFSNVFYSDINLYAADGSLLATSRPEIFEMNLLSHRMNEMAYYQLSRRQISEYVHREHIGKLSFLSAYTPFFNQNNQLLAYLNLPYFTQQSLLTREISNMIVGIVNSWMVLILISFALAVVISDQITNPLRLIQQKIGKFKLGSEYEHIVYSANDEIGQLVQEYNRMIDELARNIELLARSERESAWREMARQIAHEIKNPLTPMKLSIQQLKRSWDDKRDDFNQRMTQVTNTLVEQIDRLSTIATAFSNFARLPKTHYAPVNVISLVTEVVNLFKGDTEIRISILAGKHDEILVYADKEELNSVFINLLKNAMQSIPEGTKGVIRIEIQPATKDDTVLVTVEDNGSGIPPGLGDRLFEPNFTTKSSGMGLGLAIVRKIVEDIQGEIWYASNEQGGTTFYLKLHVYRDEAQHMKKEDV